MDEELKRIQERVKDLQRLPSWMSIVHLLNRQQISPTVLPNQSATNVIDRLESETLVKIFCKLDAKSVAKIRCVCDTWKEVIDQHKGVWRNLTWVQGSKPKPTTESVIKIMNEKTGSTLKEVEIVENRPYHGLRKGVFDALLPSRFTLTSITLLVGGEYCEIPYLDLKPFKNLKRFILWEPISLNGYPSTQVSKKSTSSVEISGTSQVEGVEEVNKDQNEEQEERTNSGPQLEVFWHASVQGDSDPHFMEINQDSIKSLKSYANYWTRSNEQTYDLIEPFAQTLVHLKLSTITGNEEIDFSLDCPNLQVVEGNFGGGFPTWINTLIVHTMSIGIGGKHSFLNLPITVRELWLHSRFGSFEDLWVEFEEICPKLEVLTIRDQFFERGPFWDYQMGINQSVINGLVVVLNTRNWNAENELRVEGIKMESIKKLVIPFHRLSENQFFELGQLVEELVDIRDHPNVLAVEY